MGYLFATLATFGGNVIALRERAGFDTAKSLALALEVAPSVVSRWENNLTGLPEAPTLLKLAKALTCSIEELLDGVDVEYQQMLERRRQDNEVEPDRVDVSGYTPGDIPLIAEGEASPDGNLFWDDEGKLVSDVEDRISRPYDVTDPRAYGLKIRGDSMVPIYRPKMLVVVSPNTPVADGDEVYAQLLTGERLIKIAYRATDGWILESANPAYPARFVPTSNIGAIHPIVWSRRHDRGRHMVDDVATAVQRQMEKRKKQEK